MYLTACTYHNKQRRSSSLSSTHSSEKESFSLEEPDLSSPFFFFLSCDSHLSLLALHLLWVMLFIICLSRCIPCTLCHSPLTLYPSHLLTLSVPHLLPSVPRISLIPTTSSCTIALPYSSSSQPFLKALKD